ncbi:MAG: amidohydrolase [Candidatus Freyarchaeota archaeon]|nr:amidohydrolase [Candidatus Jordarchaeia archaeon]MBS7267947.1 amidohydrolase [Candidatus Jordarchaeia archaeon]MBS7279863.1 amidohydrolase [Candidatus Jordarchaeia archaeon]
MIIDAHIHPYFNRTGTKGLGFVGNLEGVLAYYSLKYLRNEYGVKRLGYYLMERMFKNGIGGAVVSPFFPYITPIVKSLIDMFPDTFMGFCCVDPHDSKAGQILEFHIRQGFKGLKLHAVHQNFWPNEAMHIWEKAEKLNIPVLVHSGKIWKNDTDNSNPLYYTEIIDQFPGLKLIIAHLGGTFEKEALELAKKYDNVYLDTSGGTAEKVMIAIKALGSERIIFGSDMPFIPHGDPHYEVNKIRNLDISNEEKQLILGQNILRLVKL